MKRKQTPRILQIVGIVWALSHTITWGQGFVSLQNKFDIQGHRGFRGKWPENTWVGMHAALEAGVTTLEMDVVMSKDREVVLSHEPWMSTEICEGPGIGEGNAEPLNLYRMDYAQIRSYNCGSPKGHPRFPQQRAVVAYKPLLREIMDSVQAYCLGKGRDLPNLNIEIKSKAAWDGLYHPQIHDFVQAVVAVLGSSGMKERCIIQSFDERVPALVWQVDSGLQSACLVEYRRVWSRARFAEKVMGNWGKHAKVYSPHYLMINRRTVKQMQRRGVEVIPWTVNKPSMMKRLMRWKVNGIITDYPDILVSLRQTRAGQTP